MEILSQLGVFAAVEGIKFGFILCGIIWAVVLGFAVGNYACSLVHRLPRGRLLLDKKPYCGSCGAPLQVKDLFPVFSALYLRHRCRYCKTPYPVSHTWTEVLVGLLFVLAFFKFNFTEQFVLVTTIGVFLITLSAIESNEKMVMSKLLICIIIFGALYRTLVDHTIYEFFQGGLFALIPTAILWRKKIEPVAHVYKLPPPVELATVGGICVGAAYTPLFLALFAVFYGIDWLLRKLFKAANPPLITVSFGLATMLLVMYPEVLALL